MRIAFNASILRAPRTGIGQYVTGLVTALQQREDVEISLFLGRRWSLTLPLPTASAQMARVMQVARATSLLRGMPGAYRLRRFVEQRAFAAGVRRQPVDLYHEPSLWPFDSFNGTGPLVMTLHDLTHVHYPETQPRARLAEIERHVGKGVARAARILVDSAYIGREVVSHFGLPTDKVVVAPLGCGAEFHPRTEAQTRAALQPLGLRHGSYLLCVGTLEPRKNLLLTLRAYARLPDALRKQYPLLIVGMAGWGEDTFAGELRAALAGGHVRLAGYLGQARLAEVVAGARALVYPSLYEGFGLPVVEAMASGTPVIVSDRASLPEVAGAAGLIVDADDDVGLAAAMQMLLGDDPEWQRRCQAGLQQAAQFTWRRCAEITVQTYRAVLA
ncbi:Glycosyltransferase [Sterolibacterium denitrificans]|uniref:Glycosyltransferase n=1 Tax=Sterolibacterium denitrificans TaxID=157592 RepID=A0A7Z7HPH4_9PROT|nr:glycosyltransferase family 1 protein [Sterolibacterium denitrificans]SMB22457.1 Glycosyltransferase [Sterolibacterium denitrificans]